MPSKGCRHRSISTALHYKQHSATSTQLGGNQVTSGGCLHNSELMSSHLVRRAQCVEYLGQSFRTLVDPPARRTDYQVCRQIHSAEPSIPLAWDINLFGPMRFESTAKVRAKCKLKYYRISLQKCLGVLYQRADIFSSCYLLPSKCCKPATVPVGQQTKEEELDWWQLSTRSDAGQYAKNHRVGPLALTHVGSATSSWLCAIRVMQHCISFPSAEHGPCLLRIYLTPLSRRSQSLACSCMCPGQRACIQHGSCLVGPGACTSCAAGSRCTAS